MGGWLDCFHAAYCAGRPLFCPVLQPVRAPLRLPHPYVTPFGDAPETVLSRGGSCIVNPLGQMLAGPNFTGEGIMTADLDLADIARGKYDFDVVGHYARPDVFRLHVNEEPQPPVVGASDPIRIEC